jgi:RimJ/RimL family protein N-acetyltransferase
MLALPSATKRTLLAAPSGEDEQRYRELLLAPQVNRWLRPPPLVPLMDPDPGLWLARDISHWRQHDFGPWMLTGRSSQRFLGRVGLSHITFDGEALVELSWAIMPEYWGQGLATEVARAALVAAETLGFEKVLAYTLASNQASRRVVEKLGLRPLGEVKRAGLAHLLFEL